MNGYDHKKWEMREAIKAEIERYDEPRIYDCCLGNAWYRMNHHANSIIELVRPFVYDEEATKYIMNDGSWITDIAYNRPKLNQYCTVQRKEWDEVVEFNAYLVLHGLTLSWSDVKDNINETHTFIRSVDSKDIWKPCIEKGVENVT